MIAKHIKVDNNVFFIGREVVILKIYASFNVAKVKDLSSNAIFLVDVNTLTDGLIFENSISIKLLGV